MLLLTDQRFAFNLYDKYPLLPRLDGYEICENIWRIGDESIPGDFYCNFKYTDNVISIHTEEVRLVVLKSLQGAFRKEKGSLVPWSLKFIVSAPLKNSKPGSKVAIGGSYGGGPISQS